MSDYRAGTIGHHLGKTKSQLEINQHPLIVGTDRVGIEIELENLRELYSGRRNQSLTYWNLTTDGSLRNYGMEFITKGDGLGGDVLYSALEEVEAFLSQYEPDASWRCSDHLHLDIRDCTLDEVKRIFIAYLAYEKFLFKESGWDRYKNNFCLPMSLAQNHVEIVADALAANDLGFFLNHVGCNWGKYTALNLQTIETLGTMEFRMPQPTWKASELAKIANRFLSLKRIAKEWDVPDIEFIERIFSTGIGEVFTKSLGRRSVFTQEEADSGFSFALDLITLRALKAKSRILLESNMESFLL